MNNNSKNLKENGSSCGGISGFQAGGKLKNKDKELKEFFQRHPEVNPVSLALYFESLSPEHQNTLVENVHKQEHWNSLSEAIQEAVIKEIFLKKLQEVVRKTPDGNYVLLSPRKGPDEPAKEVARFSGKDAAVRAKMAMMSRFPPPDPKRRASLQAQIQKLRQKKKAVGRPKEHSQKSAGKPKTHQSVSKSSSNMKKESKDMFAKLVENIILGNLQENLFREERTGSEWDEYLQKIPPSVLAKDAKYQSFHKAIENKTQGVLSKAFQSIQKALKGQKDIKLKDRGIKKSPDKGKSYLTFSASLGPAELGPLYIYVQHGVPKLEISPEAQAQFIKADPEMLKSFRGELSMIQERVLDHLDDLVAAIHARDAYLSKIEDTVDKELSNMSPLQMALVKKLLALKYRKLG